jgi:hypothetical protein
MYIVLFLGGCTFGLGSSGVSSVVDTSPTAITSISPAQGSARGGTVVAILGAGFVGDVTVTFGGVPAASITVVDADTLSVTTPRVNGIDGATAVDVQVGSDNGIDTKFSGFTYTPGADTTDDTGAGDDTGGGDTDPGGDTSYAGMVSGYVDFRYSKVLCPICFGDTVTDGVTVSADAWFHTPADTDWLAWLPAENTCTSEPTITPGASSYIDAGTAVTLTAGVTAVTLTGATGADGKVYSASGLTGTDFSSGTLYDLAASGGTGVDAFSVSGAFTSALPFATLSPGPMVTTTTDQAFTSPFSKTSGATIEWTPSTGTGIVLVTLHGWVGDALSGTVVCRFANTGSATVPGSAMSAWTVPTSLVVDVARYEVSEVINPNDDSTIQVLSVYEEVGTAGVRD